MNSHLNEIILGQGTHLFPMNALSKKNHTVLHGTRNPYELYF